MAHLQQVRPQQMENNNQNNSSNNFYSSGMMPIPPANKEPEVKLQPEKKISVTPMHTFADDIKMAMANEDVSMVKIAMAEARKKEQQETEQAVEADPESGKNKFIIILSFVMLVVGGLGFVGVWYFTQTSKDAQIAAPAAHKETIIPYDEEFPVVVRNNERKEILEGLSQAKSQKFESDTSLVFLPILNQSGSTTNLFSTSAFLNLLNARTPGPLTRAFDSRFMFGLNKVNGTNKPFVLMTTTSFNQVFAGMLEWEPAIADDIGDIFFGKDELLVPQVVDPESTSTETVARPPKYILADSLSFKDEVINNRDVRALRTSTGKLLMYYAFISDKLVLVAKDFGTIDEVTRRLATSQFKQ